MDLADKFRLVRIILFKSNDGQVYIVSLSNLFVQPFNAVHYLKRKMNDWMIVSNPLDRYSQAALERTVLPTRCNFLFYLVYFQ